MSELVPTSDLERQFTDIVAKYDQTREVTTEEVAQSKATQQKFSAGTLSDVLPKIHSEAALIRRVSQTDYYFLPENTHPSYVTECICLREEKDLDEADSPVKTTLIFKSNPHSDETDSTRTVKSVTVPEGMVGAYTMLELLEDSFGEPYAQIYKERRMFLGSDANIYLDSNVIATDANKNQHYLGNFVEVTSNKDSDFGRKIAQSLGVETEQVNIPYLDYAKLERHTLHMDDSIDTEAVYTNYHHIHYDDTAEIFVPGIDTTKLDKLNKYELQEFTRKLDHIENLLSQDIKTDANLKLRLSYKPFKYFRSPLKYISESRVYRYNYNDGDTRLVISAVSLKDGTRGIILHFIGTHAQYDRWRKRHR